MKEKRKIYKPISLESFTPEYYELKGTKTELVLILLVGLIAVVFLVYKYYVQSPPKPDPPKPVEVPQEGSTLNAELTEGGVAQIGAWIVLTPNSGDTPQRSTRQ